MGKERSARDGAWNACRVVGTTDRIGFLPHVEAPRYPCGTQRPIWFTPRSESSIRRFGGWPREGLALDSPRDLGKNGRFLCGQQAPTRRPPAAVNRRLREI